MIARPIEKPANDCAECRHNNGTNGRNDVKKALVYALFKLKKPGLKPGF
jgi:hypothetical protein